MKVRFFLLLMFFSAAVFSQTQKVNIKGFGEVSATKLNGNAYNINLGKFGSFVCQGQLEPLHLDISTTIDSLREFPGFKLYKKMDLQEIEIHIGEDGLGIEASIDTKKNFGDVLKMFKIPNPTMGIEIKLSKTSFELGGELDFEDNPIVIDVVPNFSRFTLENFSVGAEWEAGEEELELSVNVSIQNRWKPTEWDPDIQSVTSFSYNLMSNEISASISMTDTWSNPMLLDKLLKPNSVEFTDVAASLDWPLGAPAPSGFGFNIGKAQFFQLEFAAQLAITPTDKKVALYAYRNELTMNDFTNILRNGFGLNVPNVFPEDIYIKDAEILFSPNGGEVGEFDIAKGFLLRGNAKLMDAIEAKLDYRASMEKGIYLDYNLNTEGMYKFLTQEIGKVQNAQIKQVLQAAILEIQIRKIYLHMEADKQLNMSGQTECVIAYKGQEYVFKFEASLSPKDIANKLIDKIKDIPLQYAEKLGKEVLKIAGPALNASINTAKGGLNKAKGMVSDYSNHVNHTPNTCLNVCSPGRANELTGHVLPASNQAIFDFYNKVIVKLRKIEGISPYETALLRARYIKRDWQKLTISIDENWGSIYKDKKYLNFSIFPERVTRYGNKFRETVNVTFQKHLNLRNQYWDKLMTEGSGEVYIKNRYRGTYTNISRGLTSCTKIDMNSQSAMWKFVAVPGTEYFLVKNKQDGFLLNIENGKLECNKIGLGSHSAHWKLEKVAGTEFVRLRNRWKGTYLNTEKYFASTAIGEGALSSQWEIIPVRESRAWNIWGDKVWQPGQMVVQSLNGIYHLVFQTDGNLVLYRYADEVVWASGTGGKGATNFKFQKDGNLVIYGNNGVIWSPNCHNKNGEALLLTDNGNLVIHAPGAKVIWEGGLLVNVIKHNKLLHITSAWKGTFLNIEYGLAVNNIGGGSWSSHWIFEPVAGTQYVKIKNRWKGTYLHIEGGLAVQCSAIQPGWFSAQWELEHIMGTNSIRIKNRWKGTYLNIQPGQLKCTDIQQDWASAKWMLDYNIK